MRRSHPCIRSALAAVALLVAALSHAESLLLPVVTAVPPYNVEVVCRGLQVRDADTAALQRSFPQLGCVRTVASAGARRAIVVSGASVYGDRTDDAARLVDLDDGKVLATVALDPEPGLYVTWARTLADNTFLVGLIQSSSTSVQTRFVRLDFDGTTLRIRADATVPGFSSETDLGDVLTTRRSVASGVVVDQYRASDLAALGSVQFDQPAGVHLASVEVIGNRMYAVVRSGQQSELRVLDAAHGILIRSQPWPTDLYGSGAHDAAGRLLATRNTRQSNGRYRVDLVAIGLDDGVETPLGTRDAAAPYPRLAHRDGRTVLLTEIIGLCDLQCSPDRPLDYAITAGPDLRVVAGDPMGVAPNSVQFLAPSVAQAGANAVPAMTPIGGAWPVLALLALVGRVSRASRV